MGCACIVRDKKINSKDIYLIDERAKVHQNDKINVNNLTTKISEDTSNVKFLEKSNKIKEKIEKENSERIILSGPIINLLKNRAKNHQKIKKEK